MCVYESAGVYTYVHVYGAVLCVHRDMNVSAMRSGTGELLADEGF